MVKMNKNKTELLAPAGDLAAFYAAIHNGADAVYLGGKRFSARASAKNFSEEEMAEAVSYAHVRGKKVYVTANILIADEEFEGAVRYAEELHRMGVDGLIVQDIGFARALFEMVPELELHASTQMSVMTEEGARFLESMGFSRVVVGREIDPAEISKIRKHTDIEIEAFCHGAICVSVSGQCLMSSLIGGRSGNRGSCAQPCRRTYEIVDESGAVVYDRGYLLSPRDLNTIDRVDELREAGVYSFKLEGRMKSAEYVAMVSRNYRHALDGEDYAAEEMAQMFNRTYTKGIGFGAFGHDLISTERPNHRGVEIGKVSADKKTVRWKVQPDADDLLEFSVHGEKKTYTVPASGVVTPSFSPDPNTKILRLQSARFLTEAAKSTQKESGRIPLRGELYIAVGKRPVFRLVGQKVVEAIGDDRIEVAKKAAVDPDRIRENLSKFGDSIYYLDAVDLQLDEKAFVPISLVNGLRREALMRYEEKELPAGLKTAPLPEIRVKPRPKKTLLTVEIAEEPQIYHLPYDQIDRLELYFTPSKEAADFLRQIALPVYFSFPYETPKGFFDCDGLFSGAVVQNLGQLGRIRGEEVAGEGLNIFNRYSFDYFAARGALMPSLECTRRQLEDFTMRFGHAGEILYYGYPRAMNAVHCPMSLKKGCGANRNCSICGYRKGYALLDEKRVRFPFRRVCDMTEIYNSLPIYLGDRSAQLMTLSPSALKIRSRLGEDVRPIIEEARRVIEGERPKDLAVQEFTRGHWNRGILEV